jgi:hypothetical protein
VKSVTNTTTRTGVLQEPGGRGKPASGRAGQGRAQREGLVSYQQSSEAPASTKKPHSKASNDVAPIGTRYRITASNGSETITIDSRQARLQRCQRRVHAWADVLPRQVRQVRRAAAKLAVGPRMVMLTLTYKDVDGWHLYDIRDFMKALHQVLGDSLYAYAWVLEMQKRGVPHYHVLLYVKRGTRIPKPDAKLWRHGLSKIETVRTPFYICKYTSKGKQKQYQKEGFPAGARMFAVKVYKTDIPPDEFLDFRMSSLPSWLRPYIKEAYDEMGVSVTWRRNRGGGWLIVQTGEVICSPWHVTTIQRLE